MKSILHSNHSFIVIDFYNSYYFFRSYLNFVIVFEFIKKTLNVFHTF